MPFGNSNDESQRDSGLKPRVARNELPWERGPQAGNPKYLFSVVGMARCAVRAAFSGATIEPFAAGLSEAVPPATARAGTSQRDVPTTLNTYNPNGVAAQWRHRGATPLGLKIFTAITQGSLFLATLGWKTQSPRDCRSPQN